MALSGTPIEMDRTAGGSVLEMGSSTCASSGTGSFGTSVRKHACEQAGSHRRIEHHLQGAFRFLTLRLRVSFKDEIAAKRAPNNYRTISISLKNRGTLARPCCAGLAHIVQYDRRMQSDLTSKLRGVVTE
jgi:hypothetical protein